jgi:hypothetical protein
MGDRPMSRKERVRRCLQQRRKGRDQQQQEAELFDTLCRRIHTHSLIPIIGDMVRNEHIFDVDFDQKIGIVPDSDGATGVDELDDDPCADPTLSVTERLACEWAYEVGFPLPDCYRISHVAQFLSVTEKGGSRRAKEMYVNFQKQRLIHLARETAEFEDDAPTLDKLENFEDNLAKVSFPDVVDMLDYPRFPPGKSDPLEILAGLPIPLYLTTSYYDFMERALIDAGKKPRTQLSLWNMDAQILAQEHRPLPGFSKDEEAIKRPIVYHLYGLALYPQSMVLTEDDHMDFLMSLHRESATHAADGVVPLYLELALGNSSLLLLGYRLHDWDFRVLFRGLLNIGRRQATDRGTGVAIQLDPKEQAGLQDVAQAVKDYLDAYFEQANICVLLGNTDRFVGRLCEEWARWRT